MTFPDSIRRQYRVAVLLATVTAVARLAAAEPETADVSFVRQIRPIFQRHCFGCHQPAEAQGGLDITSREGFIKGGESAEPLVVAGDPSSGVLLEMITPTASGAAAMPKKKPPLRRAQVDLIRTWVEQGAKIDASKDVGPVVDQDHPPRYKLPPIITSLEYSPDGDMLAVAGYHEVLLHKPDGSGRIARLIGMSERIEAVAFSPDGRQLAVAGGQPGRLGEVQIWDVAKRKLVRSVTATHDTLFGASWSHDGKLLAFGGTDATLRALEAASGREVFYQNAHSDWVLDTVFSKDSSHLVSVSRDRSMKLNVVATQRFVDNITSITPGALKSGLQAVARHPDRDELLTGGEDGIPRLYRMHREQDRKIGDDFNLIRAFPKLPGRVFSVAFSADGTRLVAASSHDGKGAVHVFQADDATRVAPMDGIEGGIYAVAFRSDGRTVASAGSAGKVYLNDSDSGRLLKSFFPVPLD